MPRRRRRGSRVSTSSEQSTNSDLSESLNSSEELPDPGLPRTYGKGDANKKRVSFNFPVEVKTKDGGLFTGTGIIKLMKTSPTPSLTDETVGRKTKGELKEVVYDLTEDPNEQDPTGSEKPSKNQNPSDNEEPQKVQDLPKKQEAPKNKEPTKKTKAAIERAKKKNTATEMRIQNRDTRENVREAIRSQVESEKKARAEFEAFNKIFKPTECLKYMNIEMHPELWSRWYAAETRRAAAALRVRVLRARDLCDAGLLVWTRRVPPALPSERGQMNLTPSKKQCDRAFYIITAEEMAALIAEDRVCAHMALKQELVGGKLTVVVFGAQNAFKNQPASNGTPCMNYQKPNKTFIDLQIELMVDNKIDLVGVTSPEDLSALVIHYTRAMAEAPFKKAKRDIDEQADFYMRGDNKNCVTVDKDGNGLSRLWEQMVAILPMSSLEVARSLGAEYKTPRALSRALLDSGGFAKIADMGVTRTNVPEARSRKLGPEFTRKLHTLFTCEDGNTVIE